MKKFLSLFLVSFLSACTTVKYNGTETYVNQVDYPELNKVITVYIGDYLVQKGTITEEDVLVVNQMIDGLLYDIPPQKYKQIGFDNKDDFYSSQGVSRSVLADPIQALSLRKTQNSKLCVVTTLGNKECYTGDYERKKQLSERGSSFQQTLIYSGRVGDKINIGYREFSNNNARPVFNNDVEYDLSSSKIIGYKGAFLEILEANNSSITYKLIKNFP